MFNKCIAAFASLTILLWVLPLGSFIKPSQEKTACDGMRAFHMCSMMNMAKPADASGDSKIKFTSSGQTTEKAKDSSSMGTQTLLQDVFQFFPPFGSEYLFYGGIIQSSLVSRSIDHPPQNFTPVSF